MSQIHGGLLFLILEFLCTKEQLRWDQELESDTDITAVSRRHHGTTK